MSATAAPRADFPALADSPIAYLDNAATTQKPEVVIEALASFYRHGYGNVGRGVHAFAERSTAAYEAARARVARFAGARSADELVFTSGATDAINLVAWGWARPRLGPGDRLVATPLEHHANFLPWQKLARETGARLCLVDIDDQGRVDLDDAAAKLAGAKLFTLTAVSNVLGVCLPLSALCRMARERGVPTLVDASQAAGRAPLAFAELGCDFMAFSAHKMLGPTGIGALVGQRDRLREIEPTRLGGGMVSEVGAAEPGGTSRWREPPWGLEAGTPHIAGAIGMAAATGYLDAIGLDRIAEAEARLAGEMIAGLERLDGVRVLGPPRGAERAGIVSFTFGPHHPHDVASILDESGVAVRAGHHCAKPLMRRLGLLATVRASLGPYNGPEDVAALLAGLERAARVLR